MDLKTVKDYWDNVFSSEKDSAPRTKSIGNETLDRALDWVCEGAHCMLDFGCGNGITLYLSAMRGTKKHVGIDLSSEGIAKAARLFKENLNCGEGEFTDGGVELLADIKTHSMDGAILFNIADNLVPTDAALLIRETARIVKPCGRVLVKLNPYLSKEQIDAWNIKTVEGDLLDDGLFLWNKDTAFWRSILTPYFTIEEEADVYYEEHDQHNRLLFLKVHDR